MVSSRPLDRKFAALADPTRREILDRLGSGPATVTELAGPFGMSVPGMLKHLRILEEAQLVHTERVGRFRECSLGPQPLDDVLRWLDTHRQIWERRLDRLEAYVEKEGERS